jgi:DNA-binding transcriptional LysR family regulator
MTPFSFRQIETLQAIAAEGSLVGAAQRLHMTPAALTARVKGLEETVGMPLFDRLPSGLRPNMAGNAALESARKIENAIREFMERMEVIRTGKGGRLAVGVVSTAKYFAPRLVSAFTQEFPGVDLRLMIGNRDEMMGALRRFDVDVALTGRPPSDIPTARYPIGAHPYLMVAPPGHRLVGRKDIRKEELAGETFLFREEGSGSRSLFDYFIGDIPIQRARIGIELGSNETIKQSVIAGLGIALISAHTIAAEIGDGRLVRLEVPGLPIIRHWYVLHRTDRDLSPAALSFRDFARERCGHFLPRLVSPIGG